MGRDECVVRLYQDDLRDAFDRFAARAWPRPAEREGGTERPAGASSGPLRRDDGPTFLFLKGPQVIGHAGTRPVRVCHAGRISAGHWIVGLSVLPEYQNSMVAPLLIKKANETLTLGLTLHVQPAASRVFRGLGWTHVGDIPQYAFVINGRRLLSTVPDGQLSSVLARCPGRETVARMVRSGSGRRAVGSALTLAQNGMSLVGRSVGHWSSRRLVCEEEAGFDEAFDSLWERARLAFGTMIVRDRRGLQETFGPRLSGFRVLTCREAGRLLGYCVLKVKQFTGDDRVGDARVGTLVDCLFDPESDAGPALVRAAVRRCRGEGADVVFCSASHPLVRRALVANGFLGLPANLKLAYWDAQGCLRGTAGPESWHVMRADSDADQNF